MSKEYNQLIAEAKAELITGTPKATKENKNAVETANPTLTNELLAERQDIVDQIKVLTTRKTQIEDIIKDAIGNKDELLVYGAKVASIARWRETAVATDVVKENFPLLDYPELYKRSNKSRLTIH